MLRYSGLLLAFVFCVAPIASAQPPLIQLLPPSGAGTPGTLGPRTVIGPTIACTDLPATSMAESARRIVAPHTGDNHMISRAGDIVVLNGGTGQGYAVGQRYYTRRVTPPLSREPVSFAD